VVEHDTDLPGTATDFAVLDVLVGTPASKVQGEVVEDPAVGAPDSRATFRRSFPREEVVIGRFVEIIRKAGHSLYPS